MSTSATPKVLVVGDPRLGDMLRTAGAQWEVQPVSPTVNAMWDAIEAGTLDSTAPVVFFSDGTGSAPDELESTLAAFAPFATTFVVAAPERAKIIIDRATALASSVPNGNPNAPMYPVPIHDTRAAIEYIKTVLGPKVQWVGVAPTESAAPSPVVSAAALASSAGYEQAHVYSQHVAAAATASIPKPANARPGQLTIASMSSKGGSGKCLRHDATIIDPQTGLPVTIEHIVEKSHQKEVAALNGQSINVEAISKHMFSGEKPTWNVTFASGRQIAATDNHPFLGRGGWKPLSDVAVGEQLALPGVMPFPQSPVRMDPSELDVLAVASAQATARGRQDLDDTDGAVITIVESASAALHPTLDKQHAMAGVTPATLRNPAKQRVVAATSSLTAKHGIAGAEVLPLATYRLPADQLARFLSLYWMTAGRVTISGEANVTLVSKRAAEMLQHLLLRFGIQSSIEGRGGDDPVRGTWQLAIHPGSLAAFTATIPLWGAKEENARAAVGDAPTATPEVFWDEVVSIEAAGVAKVYDLEVPGVANFIANDVIVHNSTTAALLAGTIAKSSAAAGQPLKVVLVDLDTRDGQVGSLIGKYMPTSINIRVMPEWNQETVLANLVHDNRLGIDALLAPVRPRNADDVGPDFYRHVIGVLQTTHDVVILDCSVNYLDPLLGTAFAMSDEILFVTTLATTSVQGMARSLTELFADPADGGLGIPKSKVGIVANQVIKNVGMGKDKLLRAALGAPLVGQIPSDQDAVLVATNSNRLSDLLKHPRLGPAFYRLAVNCMPRAQLAPISTEQVAAAQQQQAVIDQKRGLFRRA